jgi:hypothetical protein
MPNRVIKLGHKSFSLKSTLARINQAQSLTPANENGAQDFARTKWFRGVKAVEIVLQDLSPIRRGLKDLRANYTKIRILTHLSSQSDSH